MRAIGDYYAAPDAVVTGDVVLSAGVNLWFGTVVRGDLARITFGPRVNIQDGCIVHTDYDQPQTIEEGVVVGHRAVLHGSFIGRDSLIGIGALLLVVGVSFNIYFGMNWRAGQTSVLGSATARAILFSALTTGTAFGSLALSRHPGTASMGALLLISLGCTLVASLVFIPALLAAIPRPAGR